MDYDLFFYMYCFRLNRPEAEFYCSTLSKVMKMLDISNEEAAMKAAQLNNEPYIPHYFKAESEGISSMKEVEGFL